MEKKNKDPLQKGRKEEKKRKNKKTILFFDVFIQRIRLNIQRTQREGGVNRAMGWPSFAPAFGYAGPNFRDTGRIV